MEDKENYTPEEVWKIAGAYAQLVSYDQQIGGGRRIAIGSETISSTRREVREIVELIPSNVKKHLKPKVSELEESVTKTLDLSDD